MSSCQQPALEHLLRGSFQALRVWDVTVLTLRRTTQRLRVRDFLGSHSEASSAQCRLTRPWRLQTTVPSREPGRRVRPRFLALVSMRLWPDLDSAFYNICCPLRFCLRSWRMSCAQ